MQFQPFGHQSGKLGDIVVSRNRGGYFQRARVKGRNPRTADQQAHRSLLGQASSRWKNLPPEICLPWEQYAALKNFPGGGRTAYASVFRVRALLGEEQSDTPPLPASFQTIALTGVRAQVGDAGLLLHLDGIAGSDPNVRYKVEASPPGGTGRKNWDSALKIIKCPATPAELQDPAALGRAYLAKFPVPPAGRAIAIRVTPGRDGQLGPPLTFVSIVAPAG